MAEDKLKEVKFPYLKEAPEDEGRFIRKLKKFFLRQKFIGNTQWSKVNDDDASKPADGADKTADNNNWSEVVDDDSNKPSNNANEGATIGTDVKDEDANTPAQDLVVNWKKMTAGEAITAGKAVGFGDYNAAKTYTDTALWRDSYVDINNADTNYGTSDYIKIGTKDDRSVTDGKRYYMYINTDDIPEDFTEVLLKIRKFGFINATSINFSVYRVTSSWTENDITWNDKPTDDGVAWVSGTFSGTGAFQEIDITSLMIYWKAAINPNYGLVIKCTGYGGGSAGNPTYLNSFSIDYSGYEAQLSVEGLEGTGKVYLTDVTQAHSVYNFIGFAKENIAQDATGGVQILNVVSGLSSLKTNVTYFLGGTTGGLTHNPSHASGVVLKVGKALSSTTLLMKEGQKMSVGSFNASSTRYEVIKTYFRPSKIEFKVFDESHWGWGMAWGRTKQQYAVTTGANNYEGTDAVFAEAGAGVKVEIIAIYNAATLLKITYGGSASAKTINWVAVG